MIYITKIFWISLSPIKCDYNIRIIYAHSRAWLYTQNRYVYSLCICCLIYICAWERKLLHMYTHNVLYICTDSQLNIWTVWINTAVIYFCIKWRFIEYLCYNFEKQNHFNICVILERINNLYSLYYRSLHCLINYINYIYCINIRLFYDF